MLSGLFIAALRSPAGKGLTSRLLFVMFNCVFATFPCGILGQVWYLIVSILDLCRRSFFTYPKELLVKERICSPWEQILSFKRSSHYVKGRNSDY